LEKSDGMPAKKISRRKFLKTGAKVAGAVAVGGTLLKVAGCAPTISYRRPFYSGGQWPAVRKLYNWDPANKKHLAQINLVKKISSKTRLNPGQVLLSINRNGIKSYHADAVRNTVESNPKRIKKYKHWRRWLWTKGKKDTPENRKKLNSVISRLEKDLAIAKVDAKVLEAVQKERAGSDKRKAAAKDLVRTVKETWFDAKELERLAVKSGK